MTLPRSLLSMLPLVLLLLLQPLTASAAYVPGPGHDLFARQNPNCVKDCLVPPCGGCAPNQYCALSVQTCDACPKATCANIQSGSSDSGDDGGSSSPSVGPIVGGVFGGLAAAGIIGFLLYRTFIKKKKQERISMAATAAEKENDFGMLKSARASTHTVASIASTVRTRASNVIQIAYIPGVTNRSGPSTPSHLVPPIPPLPMMGSPTTSQYPRSPLAGDLQFSADDILRGSMYTVNDNRSSVATTIYGQNAVVSQPNIIRAGKAAVVTVKGGSSLATSIASSPSSTIPPVPALYLNGKGKGRQSTLEKVPPSPAFSVGSTFLNRMNSAKKLNTDLPKGAIGENHSTASFIYDSDDSDDDIKPGQRIKRPQSACSSCITDMDTSSPFSDTNSLAVDDIPGPSNSGQLLTGNTRRLSQSLAQRQSRTLDAMVVSSQRTVSPFDDSNSIEKQ
ncbi:hypothetical protein HOY82DRAFT_648810 [Tuber indicum]|nr:hypothetical protein HOY82DRAFT_648810 [Tuber indicum]